VLTCYRCDVSDRLNRADLIVSAHDGDEASVWTDCPAKIVSIDNALCVDWNAAHGGAEPL
jgi:hypothetical protein